MRIEEWLEIYRKVCADLDISEDTDRISANILSGILGEESRLELLDPYRGGTFYVIGNGPNLAEGLEKMGDGRVIVADSALSTYMKYFPAPDIVVTDLDGDMHQLELAFEGGSLMVIHAHGDNMELVREHAAKFLGKAIGSTQNLPLNNVYNFYGFTDGDRGAFLADFLGAEKINLIGFEFQLVGIKPGINRERKLKKLKWARFLLDILARQRGTELKDGTVISL